MNKDKFDKYMAMRSAGFYAPKGHYVIDGFFEDFLKDKPTKDQFKKIISNALGSEEMMYCIWSIRP